MPIFKVEIFKEYQGERWGNVYHVAAGDLSAASNSVSIIVAAERAIHFNVTAFVSARVSDLVVGTDAFYTIPLTGFGSVGPGAAALPLWNTLRVDFPATGGGRPSRKFYRGCLDETTAEYLTIATAKLNAVQVALSEMIIDLATEGTSYVDVDGQLLDQAVPWPRVQMRQLHRKRRRSAAPA